MLSLCTGIKILPLLKAYEIICFDIRNIVLQTWKDWTAGILFDFSTLTLSYKLLQTEFRMEIETPYMFFKDLPFLHFSWQLDHTVVLSNRRGKV